jgi:type IV pilus assembly protein PilQ
MRRASRYRHTAVLALCVVLATGAKASLAASAAGAEAPGHADPAAAATLKKIASRVDGRAGIVAIEASDPVSYVAAQPDPRTFVVELRDVTAAGFADNFKADPRHPVSTVQVESGLAGDGTTVTRVRMSLARPLRPRVRSSRNVIYVEAERLDRGAAPASAPLRDVVPPGNAPLLAPASPPVPGVLAVQATQPPPAAPAPQTPPTAPGAQAPTPAPQTPQQPAPAAPPRFTGFPISLDFQGADLRAVLRTFAEISGLNIVIDPAVQGTVDVALRDVPWDQALDIILRANRLGYTVDGTIVRIAPLTVLAQEQAERQKLAEAQALAGELQTLTRTLSYAQAEQVQPLLERTVLSQRGSITTDPRTNTLIITDLPERLARAAELVMTLDRPEPQVEIEARIVQTNRDFARQLGVQWGFTGRATADLGNTLPLTFPNQAQIGGRTGQTQGPEGVDRAVNLGVTNPAGAVGIALGAINGSFNLDVALSALERSGQGRLLSTPRVTTQNNIEAQIQQGIQIPIQTVANNTVTVTFRDATLRLSVTPRITSANTVIMRIVVANEAADFSRQVNGIPPIDTQSANTSVLVNDGETTVIGGIYVSREQTLQDRTPGLYRIPLLGWLFQRNQITDENRELLIFITPRIIRL